MTFTADNCTQCGPVIGMRGKCPWCNTPLSRRPIARTPRPPVNFKHGRATLKARTEYTDDYRQYRRELRLRSGMQHGRLCTADTADGRPCINSALFGSPFCVSHDPATRDGARQRAEAASRAAAAAREAKLVRVGPVQQQVVAIMQQRGWLVSDVARATGVPHGTVSRLLKRSGDGLMTPALAARVTNVEMEEARNG